MVFDYLDKIIFEENSTIIQVLEGFNETAIYTESRGFAITVDKNGKCVGVISDGDIRRKLLEGVTLDSRIKKIINRDFVFVTDEHDAHYILRQFDKHIKNLPVLDSERKPIDLYQYSNFLVSSRSEQRIIRARVPVRMSYSGGGADVSAYINKAPAAVLSSTINKYCTASIMVRKDRQITIRSKDLNLNYSAKSVHDIEYGDDLDLIKSAIKIMEPDFGFDLETYTEFEPGTGLGGSSAIVVSVLGALNYFRNEKQLDIYQLSDIAYQVERIDMKIQGGWQDQYATTFGGFSWIEFRKKEIVVTPLLLQRDTILELEYNLMLFRLGANRSSTNIQEKYIREIASDNKDPKLFTDMIEIAGKMKDALLKGETKAFGDFLHKSWGLKQAMNIGVTSPLVEECYKTARELGALGGKLLGAGHSGYLLVYASPLYQKRIKEALAEKGVNQEGFKFCQEGLEVWSTRR